jgi:transcriptional regulator with XRE-family HTH domain
VGINANSLLPQQIRSARALLGWSQKELARRARVATSTVADFERGAREPTTNNSQSMVKALEDGGVAFQGDTVARNTTASGSAQPVSGRTPFRWIEVADLEDWATRRGSQELLPELICRLIRADKGLEAQLRMPSADAISMKGWDGQCHVQTASLYVPSGASGWELTVQKEGIKGKADGVYRDRTLSPGTLVPPQSSFVFVAARRWETKDEWVKAKTAEGCWQQVRAYDAADLVHWMEALPSVAMWLAEKVGKRPDGIRDLQAFWNEWSQATERPIAPTLVLAGRDEESTRCVTWVQGGPSLLSLQGESAAEAISFVYAAIAQLPFAERNAFLTRSIVVTDAGQARKLGESLTSLYLILEVADAGLVHALVGKCHHVCCVFGSEIGIPVDVLRLPRLSRQAAEAALCNMGYTDDQATNVARDIGGSVAVFRRLYPSAPERALPDWAQPQNARDILPAFFAGAWDEGQPTLGEQIIVDKQAVVDREVLRHLSGKTFEDFQRGLSRWAAVTDSPLRKSGSIWKIASPRDALFRLAPCISSADLKRFSETIKDVFRTSDPRYSLAPDKRWLAGVYGQLPQHSPYMRTGLGETLLVLALFGEKARVGGSKMVTEAIVRDLLHGADAERWWSLSQQMRLLSEAAPDQFLSAVSDSLQKNKPSIMELFKEDGGLMGGAHHSDLLWALEGLAWDPKYLPHVASLLATMARLDPPGGRHANRPLSSLRTIFVWWKPQTCADFSERLAALDLIRQSEPDIAWRLMLALLPGGPDHVLPTPKPRWREVPPELPEQSNTQAMFRWGEAIADRLLEDVGGRADRWVSLIETLPNLPPKHFEQACKELSARSHTFDKEARASLWKALRVFLHQNRCFAEAQWALPEEAIARFDVVYAAFALTDHIERISWLFDSQSVPLPLKLEGGWEAYDKEADVWRRECAERLWTEEGADGIDQLAQVAAQPVLVGFALAQSSLSDQAKDALLVRSLQSFDLRLHTVARGLIGKILEREKGDGRGEEWAYRLLDRAGAEEWSDRALLDILLIMDTSSRLWERVEQCPPNITDDYWKALYPYRVPHTAEAIGFAVEKFMKYGRAADLMALVSQHPQTVSGDRIIEILREARHSLNQQPDNNALVMFQHYLELLLATLDKRNDVDNSRIAELEWLYLPVLKHSGRSLRTLHKTLSENPAFFVDVLKAVYRSSSDTDSTERNVDEERHERLVTQAYQVLSSWHLLPGMCDGVVDGAKLEAWVAEVRRQAAEEGRIGPCDAYVGKILAWAPSDDDGIWPAAAVRKVIEISRSEVIEQSIGGGVLEKRGVTTRNPTDGGNLEKSAAAQYRAWSEAVRFKSPRTSVALENVAQMFDGLAEGQDQLVERSSWL